jgi:hypothetical protein
MIDSGSRSQVRLLESFKRSRFGLLAIASFIIQYFHFASVGGSSAPICSTRVLPVKRFQEILPTSPFERSRFAADAFACQVAAVCVKE